MNVHAAAALTSRWDLEGNRGSTTTLGVGDDGTTLAAGGGVLAGRAILHAVVEFDISIHINGDLHLGDGEALVAAARDLRAAVRVLGDLARDALALEVSLGKCVTLAWAIGASEAREAEATEGREGPRLKPAPVEATTLLTGTLIVGVGGAVELAGGVPGGIGLLGKEACSDNGGAELHDGRLYSQKITSIEKRMWFGLNGRVRGKKRLI